MIRNPLYSRTDEEVRLESLIRKSLNDHWASTANNVYDAMRYAKRSDSARKCHELHQDKDTTENWQVIEPTTDLSDLTEL